MTSQGSGADPPVEPKSSPSSTPAVVPASVVNTSVVKDGGVTTDPMDVTDSINRVNAHNMVPPTLHFLIVPPNVNTNSECPRYDNSPGSSSFPRPSVPGISDSFGPSFSQNTPQANNSLSNGHSFQRRM
nr:hypothetical protein [Tanacetum cinerariifolium]